MADPAPAFIWGDAGAQMTPAQIAALRKVAEAHMTAGMDYSPVKSWSQGAARVAQGIFGGMMAHDANAADKANAAADKEFLDGLPSIISGGSAAPSTAPVSAPPATSPSAPPVVDAGTPLNDAIAKVAAARNVDPAYLTKVASIESGGNPNIGANPNSTAKGPFQFINSTARQYGLGNPSDPVASTDAAARLTLDNKAALTSALGREPTQGELYLAHQQGAGGAAKLLANPNAPVESVIGVDAARNNGATPGMTAGQFAQKWTSRFQTAAQPSPDGRANLEAAAANPPVQLAQASAPSAAPTTAPASPMAGVSPALLHVIASPYASEGTKKIAGLILQTQLQEKSKLQEIGSDPMTGEKKFAEYDPRTHTLKPITIPAAPGAQPAQTPLANLHGEEFLTTLEKTNSPVASQVRAIVEGRAPYPTGMLLKTPYGQTLAQYVTQADPAFESGNPAARTKMQADLSTGTLGKNNNALNTAIGHLGELSDAATKLNNKSFTPYNSVGNFINTVTGAPEVTNFNTIRDKVAEEFTKVYRGAGGSEADIKREIENMNAANSPAQLHGAIANMARLAQSKIDANEAQYKNTMGSMVKYAPMVTDKTKKTLELLEQRESGKTEAAPAASGVIRYDAQGNRVQ